MAATLYFKIYDYCKTHNSEKKLIGGDVYASVVQGSCTIVSVNDMTGDYYQIPVDYEDTTEPLEIIVKVNTIGVTGTQKVRLTYKNRNQDEAWDELEFDPQQEGTTQPAEHVWMPHVDNVGSPEVLPTYIGYIDTSWTSNANMVTCTISYISGTDGLTINGGGARARCQLNSGNGNYDVDPPTSCDYNGQSVEWKDIKWTFIGEKEYEATITSGNDTVKYDCKITDYLPGESGIITASRGTSI